MEMKCSSIYSPQMWYSRILGDTQLGPQMTLFVFSFLFFLPFIWPIEMLNDRDWSQGTELSQQEAKVWSVGVGILREYEEEGYSVWSVCVTTIKTGLWTQDGKLQAEQVVFVQSLMSTKLLTASKASEVYTRQTKERLRPKANKSKKMPKHKEHQKYKNKVRLSENTMQSQAHIQQTDNLDVLLTN